ncbi:hypothetical protein FISHEDRAFT_69420 [Fistulina hepatica ATCC 64428]|uniref:Uncharacterized protein n=1 Tax=Fistulina hepatica ATCC 64428 TaxID=1128425 RepID=A0A0D7ANS0_9AGAR|nr:hypothetical protein FISHEDRAFT_69420 [Fistulina hepatica ATCC 64428]
MATSSADATSNVGQLSPISQVLRTLGITREDLLKRSAQMREFLNEGDYETAIASGASDIAQCGGPAEYGQSESQSESASAMSSGGCSKSQSTSASYTDASHSPAVKEEPCEAHLPSPRTTAEAENRGIGPPKDATTPADSKLANVERKLHAADASYTLPVMLLSVTR